MVAWAVWAALVVVVAVTLLVRRSRSGKTTSSSKLPLPPGTLGLPWFGDTGLGLYLRHPAEWNTRKRAIYGDVFKARLFWRDTILLSLPLDNHWLLHGEGKFVNVAHPWTWKQLLGAHSLSVAVGEDHARKRAVLSKAFTPTAIGLYAPVIEKITRETLSSWATKSDFQLNEAKPFAFRMATSILLGLDLSEAQATAFTDLFTVWLKGFMGLPFDLPFTTFGRAMKARRELLVMVEQVILQRRERDMRDAADAVAQPPARDILSILLHDMTSGTEETLSMDELKDQVLLQMFAGHDTTSAALTSLAFVIANYPDVRQRLQAEVAAAFPDPSQPVPAEALSGEYLNAVIKEVLRVYTPVGGGFRDLAEDVEYQKWLFPKGWKIRFSGLASHSDASVWPQPDKFDPDRFLEPRREDQKVKGGYIPWGGGARVCLGQRLPVLELRMFAILLVRCYDAEVVGPSTMHYFPFQFPLTAFRVRSSAALWK